MEDNNNDKTYAIWFLIGTVLTVLAIASIRALGGW